MFAPFLDRVKKKLILLKNTLKHISAELCQYLLGKIFHEFDYQDEECEL